MTEFVSVPAITVICYLIAEAVKNIPGEKFDKWIPCICGLFGAILGLVAFYTIADYIPATNWLTALAVGIVSGFAATGVNQVIKQLSPKSVDTEDAE